MGLPIEFENRLEYFRLEYLDGILNKEDIRRSLQFSEIIDLLNSNIINIEYNKFYFEDTKHPENVTWIDVECIDAGWLWSTVERGNREDIIEKIKEHTLREIDNVINFLSQNIQEIYRYQKDNKYIFHIVNDDVNNKEREEISLYLELEDK
ncbi:hypothetical protein [Staphylococcus phage ZCSS1]|uniref:Uncharacterized protein n=1 Tax=Staphylococcus phage UHP46 TaxID=3234966 RepID=A0AB39C832_9CAUD|nr:hypothetical protein [Staphylococcus phage ZCSS1]